MQRDFNDFPYILSILSVRDRGILTEVYFSEFGSDFTFPSAI